MKTTTVLALALALACAAGCSKTAQGRRPRRCRTGGTAAAQEAPPAADIKADQPVSPSLAVSGDIVAACGIKAPATPTPTFEYDKDELTPPRPRGARSARDLPHRRARSRARPSR